LIPLSFAQLRLWFYAQVEGSSALYNVPLVVRLRGELDVAALRLALGDVVARHESLRTVFVEALARVPFDLVSGPLVRACVLVAGPGEFVLVLVLHHIVVDGWSMGPLLGDLAVAYGARVAGAVPGWVPLPVQYADYALWQRELLGDEDDPGSVLSRELGFWRGQLAGLPEGLE
jgi:hypothetical protein